MLGERGIVCLTKLYNILKNQRIQNELRKGTLTPIYNNKIDIKLMSHTRKLWERK